MELEEGNWNGFGSILSLLAAFAAGFGAIASAAVAFYVYRKNRSPEVIAFVGRAGSSVPWFVLQNIGNGVAYDVELDSGDLPSRPDSIKEKFEVFKDFGVPLLAPGQTRRIPVYEATASIEVEPTTYRVNVKYASKHGGQVRITASIINRLRIHCGQRRAKP